MRQLKYTLVLVLVAVTRIAASAQENNLFADLGTPLGALGFSATYNYKLPGYTGFGIGIQGYNFWPSKNSDSKFVPAIFGDVRFYHPKKKHLFFYLIDIGVNFYTFDKIQTQYKTTTSSNDGVYFGFGMGYFRPLTKRGGGPYISLKFISNSCILNEYYLATGEHAKAFNLNGTLALSIGFKF